MPKTGRPRNQKRAVLSWRMQSILFYGVPVWEKLERTQRKILLKVADVYCTASSKALQVITEIVPIELQVDRRRFSYMLQKGTEEEKKRMAKERTIGKWQKLWEANDSKGQWANRFQTLKN